jgi:anti-anti-sigma regulatory factor
MTIELVKGDLAWTLKLGGAPDIFDVGAVHRAACEAVASGTGPVVVSLQEVESIDTSITQVLLALRRALTGAGRELRVEGTPPAVRAAWRRLGVDEGGA